MLRILRSIASFSSLVVIAAAGAAGCGGNDTADNCKIVCDKNAECQTDAASAETCRSSCRELAKEEAYDEALAYQAECYETATCQSIAFGGCDPQDI